MATIIPLSNDPSGILEITLNGLVYRLQTKFNSRGSGGDGNPYWTLDIYLGEDPIALGIALVLGVDILRQLNLGIGGMFMFDKTETHTEATEDSLGAETVLIYFTPSEIETLQNG